jgi:hypothetical protein
MYSSRARRAGSTTAKRQASRRLPFELAEADDEGHHQVRQDGHLHEADVDVGDRLQGRRRLAEEQPDEDPEAEAH